MKEPTKVTDRKIKNLLDMVGDRVAADFKDDKWRAIILFVRRAPDGVVTADPQILVLEGVEPSRASAPPPKKTAATKAAAKKITKRK